MDFQSIADSLYAPACIVSVERKTDGVCGDIRIIAANQKYIDLLSIRTKYHSDDNIKFSVVDKVKEYVISKGYKFIDIDGVRVTFDDGWALVRCSNTGPNITARFESTSEARLKEIQDEFRGVINEFNK